MAADPSISRSPKFQDMTNQRYGRLVVIEYAGYYKKATSLWRCRCDCGNETTVKRLNLINGYTQSCGCLRTELASKPTKHFLAWEEKPDGRRRRIPEFGLWQSLIRRACGDEKAKHYRDRGIGVCSRWINGDGIRSGFDCFIEDVGRRPSLDHSIDRIENDGDYEPGNCRWATQTVQMRNTRANKFITVRGITKTVAEWSEITGINYGTLQTRLKLGWPPEKAISAPLRKIKTA